MNPQNQPTPDPIILGQQGTSKNRRPYLFWILGLVIVIGVILVIWFKQPSSQPALPASFPSDIPIYPGSKLLGGSEIIVSFGGEGLNATYSSTDSVADVIAYLMANSAAWNLKDRSAGTLPQAGAAQQLDPSLNTVLEGQQNSNRLMITVSNSEGKTLINYAVTLK